MAWPEPTFQDWVDDLKALWAALRPTADSTKFSDAWLYQHTLGHIAKKIQEMVGRGFARLMPTTSSSVELANWLFFVGRPDGQGSYGLIQPHVSSGTDCLAVVFTGVAEINPTHELTDDAGRRYKINETYTSGGAETYNADVVSIDTGLGVNLESGETLIFSNPPANVNSSATLISDLDFGRGLEEDDDGRAALVEKMQKPPLSGNWVQWKNWIEEAIPGTLDAWIWKSRCNAPYGEGTTDFVATQRGEVGGNRAWTATQKSTVATYLTDEAEAPVLHIKNGRGLDFTDVETYVSYVYKLSESAPSSNQCDWDAYAEQRTVDSVDIPNKTITVNAVYTTGPSGGDKCFIAGKEATVSNGPGEGGNGMDEITFTTWPWSVTLTDRGDTVGFSVCSGGGLVVTVFTAIQAYLNGIDGTPPTGRGNLPKLGPAAGPYAAPITGWDDTFRLDMIKSAAAIAANGWILSHTSCLIGGVAADSGPTYDSTDHVKIMVSLETAVWEDKT